MNPATLKALKGSIEKWERIVRSHRGIDDGADNCPLCYEFGWDGECSNCPVQQYTNESICDGSPYEDWITHQREHKRWSPSFHRKKGCQTCLDLAIKERDFLKSLWPKGER